MRLLIHDLEANQFNTLFPEIGEDVTIISDNKTIRNCIGCFGCWIKTPGACVIKDEYKDMGKLISQCDELIIMSKCYYGGFSPFIKNVLDRSISYVLPFFLIRNGEMHHKSRYKKQINLSTVVYSEDMTIKEKETMERLVIANAVNFNVKQQKVFFCSTSNEISEVWRNQL